jgi:hypothetical protein
MMDDPERFGKLLLELAGRLLEGAPAADDEEEPAEAEDEDDEDDVAAPAPSGAGKAARTDELRDALKLVFMLIAAVYRDALALASGAPGDAALLPVAARAAATLAQQDAPAVLERAVQAVVEAEIMLDRNVAPALTCERLAIALTGALV